MRTLNYLPIFEALGHETRLRVFAFIYRSGEVGARPKEMIKGFSVDSGTLDFHLKKLINVGLIVHKAGKGRGIYCPSENIPNELTQLFESLTFNHFSSSTTPADSMSTHLEFFH